MSGMRAVPGVPIFLGIAAAAALVALAILHQRAGIGTDAAVGFFGSVLGTAGAVLGALYVEHFKRSADQDRDKDVLRASLTRLKETLDALGQEPVSQGTASENFDLELGLLEELRHAMMETDVLLQAADYGRRSGSAQLIVDLHRLQRVIEYKLPLLTEEIKRGRPRGDWLEQRAVELLEVGQDTQESLLPRVKAAITTAS
ncbi:MAG: hypothetical protein EON58_02310 [Alphaproteobacteria bacterium]|nr:MAG: hypothetical protein EON58_02310 [Alphaproteobacteria bacterium]